jgi:hypothetical protein
MTSRDAMSDASFWLVGGMVMLLVLGAAFLSVLGREKERWLADQPPPTTTQAPAPETERVLTIPQPVKIAPPVVLVSRDAAARQGLVPMMVTPADQVVVLPQTRTTVRKHTVVRETPAPQPQPKPQPSGPPESDDPPRDTGTDLVCVGDLCLEQGEASLLPFLIGARP